MKNATTSNGKLVIAGPDAPETAICPDCGCAVVLRSRRKMNSDERTYFWQHDRGSTGRCQQGRRVRRPAVHMRN